jgi:threonine/homoserine/homoserine lactone efflux protein
VNDAIGQSLPIAVGVLASPMPIVALVLMLVSRRARSNGLAFVIGWVVGIFLVGIIVVLVTGAATGDEGPTSSWVGWVKIVLGLLLLLVGIKQWRGRPRGEDQATTPTWMAAIEDFSPVKAFGTGFALSALNPKNLILVVAGAAAIATATTDTTDRILAMVVFTVVASLGVAIPYGIYLSMGERAAELLGRIKTWMIANNAVIMAVLLLVIGVKVLGDGLSIV